MIITTILLIQISTAYFETEPRQQLEQCGVIFENQEAQEAQEDQEIRIEFIGVAEYFVCNPETPMTGSPPTPLPKSTERGMPRRAI